MKAAAHAGLSHRFGREARVPFLGLKPSQVLSSAGMATGVAVTMYFGAQNAYNTHEESKLSPSESQNAKLERAIQPSAAKLAEFVLQHSVVTANAQTEDTVYSYGSRQAGHTTISASFHTAANSIPESADVTKVVITDWEQLRPQDTLPALAHVETLQLLDGTWSAVEVSTHRAAGSPGTVTEVISSLPGDLNIAAFEKTLHAAHMVVADALGDLRAASLQ